MKEVRAETFVAFGSAAVVPTVAFGLSWCDFFRMRGKGSIEDCPFVSRFVFMCRNAASPREI